MTEEKAAVMRIRFQKRRSRISKSKPSHAVEKINYANPLLLTFTIITISISVQLNNSSIPVIKLSVLSREMRWTLAVSLTMANQIVLNFLVAQISLIAHRPFYKHQSETIATILI